METRGRKPSIYPQEEIDNIIYRFTQEAKVSGWIKYSDVFRFAKALYEEGEIPHKLSEDFWRRDGRQGKETIDKANKAYEKTLVKQNTSETDIWVDTEECVNKFFTGKPTDKKKLINALKINEKRAKDSNKLLTKIDTLKGEIDTLKAKNKELEGNLEQHQKFLFSWFYASVKPDVPLINLMTTGDSRHPIVNSFFENAFSDPMEGYRKFEEFLKKYKSKDETPLQNTQDNVVKPNRKSRLQLIGEKYKQE